jgi:hypothetical protein
MRNALVFALLALALLRIPTANAQHTPTIFDVSDVVAGAQRLPTKYLFATGKWSDAGEHVGVSSTQIHCYQRFGFCEAASALSLNGESEVSLDSYDILRWDTKEIIAVDSSPICVVNTLRFDLLAKKITISSASKGVTKDPFCKGSENEPTAFLDGEKDELDKIYKRAK